VSLFTSSTWMDTWRVSGNEAGGISYRLAGAEVQGCNKHSLVLISCRLVLYLNFCCKLLVDVVFCLLKYINNNNYHSQ
jgi:hypothetical protein